MTLTPKIAGKTTLSSISPVINRPLEMLPDPSTSLNDPAATLSTDAAFCYPEHRIAYDLTNALGDSKPLPQS